VFKVIQDKFRPPKEVDHATVKAKYQLVKRHDRVGRMADTLEFSDVALPRARMSQELVDELRRTCAESLQEDGAQVVIKHVYIERRIQPLNLYLDRANAEQVDQAVRDYGNAIKELALANIFPGDMLFKNFGITRYGRVVFYDYDELEYLPDCNFRRIPAPPNPEFEMSDEPWYGVSRNDVFPEEFAQFLLGSSDIREAFLRHHPDLLTPEFWHEAQQRVASGQFGDFFPYPESLRFRNAFSGGEAGEQQREAAPEIPRASMPHLSPDLLSEVEID
jgi:isocitrate dehydrogenase kinase/phosphatase